MSSDRHNIKASPTTGDKAPATHECLATVEGAIVYFRFRAEAPNDEGEYAVIAVIATREGQVTVKGGVVDPDELLQGRRYRFTGEWADWRGEPQLAFVLAQELPSTDLADVADFLRRMGGLTEKRAAKLVSIFGAAAPDRVIANPDGVAEACGLKPEIIREAAERLAVLTVRVSSAAVELHALLRRHASRLPRKVLATLLRRYRGDAVRVVRDEPFRLLLDGVPGVGFVTADRIFLGEGGPERERDPIRGAYRLWHELDTDRNGSTIFRADNVLTALAAAYPAIAAEDALALSERTGLVCRWNMSNDDDVLSVTATHRQERRIASAIRESARTLADWPIGPFAGLRPSQNAAFSELLRRGRVVALLGPPGSGKTYCAAAVAKAAADRLGASAVAGCALAAKAALRFGQTLAKAGASGIPSTTIHALLEAVPGANGFTFRRNRDNPLEQLLVVTDEGSMLDVSLLSRLLDAVNFTRTHLLLVGDLNQLPPVGAGAPLRDLVVSGSIQSVALSEIIRNSGLITKACAAVATGHEFTPATRYDPVGNLNPNGNSTNVVHYPIPAGILLAAEVERVYLDEIVQRAAGRLDAIDDVQVIVGTNAVRHELNKALQNRLNPDGESLSKSKFRNGDKIINLKNVSLSAEPGGPPSVFVSNGDIGRIVAIDQKKRRLAVQFADGRIVVVPVGEVKGDVHKSEDDDEGQPKTGCTFDLAYGITGHKAQGSEWPHVVVAIVPGSGVGCKEWYYTAISRATRCTHLVGSMTVLAHQCQRSGLTARRTGLADLLGGPPL